MTTLAPSFLIGSSSFLHVTKTIIKAWMSLNFKQNEPRTEEHLEKSSKTFNERPVVTMLASSFPIFAANKDNHKSLK